MVEDGEGGEGEDEDGEAKRRDPISVTPELRRLRLAERVGLAEDAEFGALKASVTGVLSRYVQKDDLLEEKRDQRLSEKRGSTSGGGEAAAAVAAAAAAAAAAGEAGEAGDAGSEAGSEEERMVSEWEREFAEDTYESEISQMTPLVVQILEAYLKFRCVQE